MGAHDNLLFKRDNRQGLKILSKAAEAAQRLRSRFLIDLFEKFDDFRMVPSLDNPITVYPFFLG